MSDPKLYQIVRWREPYVSSALNAKFFGILPTGIYKGYVLSESSVPMSVQVGHGTDGRSVALVERDGYSLTIHMTDGGTLTAPSVGTWYVCVEGYYLPRAEGYQRLVLVETPEDHHIILGKIIVTEDEVIIDTTDRNTASLADVLSNKDFSSVAEAVADINNTQKGSLSGLSGAVAEGEYIYLPEGMYYYPGTGTLMVFWDGLKLTVGENYEEVEAGEDGTSNAIKTLFDVPEDSLIEFVVLGYSANYDASAEGETGTTSSPFTALSNRIAAIEAQLPDILAALLMPDAAEIFEDELNKEDADTSENP